MARATTKGNLKIDAFAHGVAVATSLTAAGVLTACLLTAEGEIGPHETEFDINEVGSWAGRLAVPASETDATRLPVIATPALLAQLPVLTETGLTVIRARPRGLSVRPRAA